MATIVVNGAKREVQAPADTPLLYVLRNDLELSGPQFGCGLAQCGACSVLLNGKEVRSCITPVSAVGDKEVTTLEGLPARWAKQRGLSRGAGGENSSSRAAGVDRRASASVRILPERHDDQSDRTAGASAVSHSGGDQGGIYNLGRFPASLPLWNLYRDHPGCATRCHANGEKEGRTMIANHQKWQGSKTDVFGATLSRRGFVKTGGALLAGFRLIGAEACRTPAKPREATL